MNLKICILHFFHIEEQKCWIWYIGNSIIFTQWILIQNICSQIIINILKAYSLYNFIIILYNFREEDLTEFEKTGSLYQAGLDKQGRPVIVFIGELSFDSVFCLLYTERAQLTSIYILRTEVFAWPVSLVLYSSSFKKSCECGKQTLQPSIYIYICWL